MWIWHRPEVWRTAGTDTRANTPSRVRPFLHSLSGLGCASDIGFEAEQLVAKQNSAKNVVALDSVKVAQPPTDRSHLLYTSYASPVADTANPANEWILLVRPSLSLCPDAWWKVSTGSLAQMTIRSRIRPGFGIGGCCDLVATSCWPVRSQLQLANKPSVLVHPHQLHL